MNTSDWRVHMWFSNGTVVQWLEPYPPSKKVVSSILTNCLPVWSFARWFLYVHGFSSRYSAFPPLPKTCMWRMSTLACVKSPVLNWQPVHMCKTAGNRQPWEKVKQWQKWTADQLLSNNDGHQEVVFPSTSLACMYYAITLNISLYTYSL